MNWIMMICVLGYQCSLNWDFVFDTEELCEFRAEQLEELNSRLGAQIFCVVADPDQVTEFKPLNEDQE